MLAYLLVARVSAGATAALVFREARNAILTQAQDTAVIAFRNESTACTPCCRPPATIYARR